MGTLIAQGFALQYPEKVNSLVILGGYDINGDNSELKNAQRSEFLKWILKAIFSMDAFRKYVASVSVINPQEKARVYEMAKKFNRKSFTVMSGLENLATKKSLTKRNYSLLILTGDQDIELAIKMSKKWHVSEPGSEYGVIENAGHGANMDNPAAFNSKVLNFLEKN